MSFLRTLLGRTAQEAEHRLLAVENIKDLLNERST